MSDSRHKMHHGLKFWKNKQSETLVIIQPLSEIDPITQKQEDFINVSKNIAKSLDSIDTQITILKGHYREYSNELVGFKNQSTKPYEIDISNTLDSIYKNGNIILNALKEINPSIHFKNINLDQEQLDKYQSEYDGLTHRFKTLWVKLYDLKEKHKLQKISFVNSFMKINHPNATDVEIENAVNQIVDKADLSDKKIFNTYSTLTEIVTFVQARHDEILRLEGSLNEVHQLYIDMWALTQQQGYTIDSIRANIQAAKENVREGVTTLAEANKYTHKRSFM